MVGRVDFSGERAQRADDLEGTRARQRCTERVGGAQRRARPSAPQHPRVGVRAARPCSRRTPSRHTRSPVASRCWSSAAGRMTGGARSMAPTSRSFSSHGTRAAWRSASGERRRRHRRELRERRQRRQRRERRAQRIARDMPSPAVSKCGRGSHIQLIRNASHGTSSRTASAPVDTEPTTTAQQGAAGGRPGRRSPTEVGIKAVAVGVAQVQPLGIRGGHAPEQSGPGSSSRGSLRLFGWSNPYRGSADFSRSSPRYWARRAAGRSTNTRPMRRHTVSSTSTPPA
jgi:hypothetical protein